MSLQKPKSLFYLKGNWNIFRPINSGNESQCTKLQLRSNIGDIFVIRRVQYGVNNKTHMMLPET